VEVKGVANFSLQNGDVAILVSTRDVILGDVVMDEFE